MILPRGIWILIAAIVVSVTLNLFFAGGLIGRQFRPPPQPPSFDQRLEMMWQRMPDADKPTARDIVARRRDEILGKWRVFHESALRANESLRATPFDEDQARSALRQSNALGLTLREAIQDALIEIAGKTSPEGRQQLRSVGGP